MKILKDLIASLNKATVVTDIRQGVFYTGVLSQSVGLAATMPRDVLKGEPPYMEQPGKLLGKSTEELVEMSYSGSILEAAVGLATINSLLQVNEEMCLELNAAELVVEKGRDSKVAMVGHFPFVTAIRENAKELWVIEKNPREGDYTEQEASRLIPRADVVAISGTTLLNNTLEDILELCPENAFVLLIGATTPLSPILFKYGIDAVAGSRSYDNWLVLESISQGATYRQIKGIKRLVMMK